MRDSTFRKFIRSNATEVLEMSTLLEIFLISENENKILNKI